MSEITRHEPGSFCWVELATTDAAGAKAFYNSLFDWSFVDTPMGPDAAYTRCQLRGRDVAALYPQDKAQRDQGVPPNWGTYVATASADASAAKARELGATVLLGPFDVMSHGRMAMVQDAQGAVFSLWEAREHTGVQLRDETGSLCWNELYTRDTEAAGKFYTALFGWRSKSDAGGYTEWETAQGPQGGMIAIDPSWGPVPPHWLPYFLVTDCDATTRTAQDRGGRAMMPPRDIPNVGRFAMLTDPQGATFAVIKMDPGHLKGAPPPR
jgi:predicted enzyme related to lactoylglutathione lyase